jgi:hypothetical protein
MSIMGELMMLKIVIMQPTKAVQVKDMNIHLMMVIIGKVMVIHLIHTHATIEEK